MCPARIACHYHLAWRRPARQLREMKIGQFTLSPSCPSTKARRDNELAAGLIARRAGTWRTAGNLKNHVRTLFGLFSTASEPEGPKSLTAYAILELWDHNDDSKALPAPANRYPLN